MNSSSDTTLPEEKPLTPEQAAELQHAPVEEPGESVDPEALRKAVEERAKDRPILQKIVAKIRKESAPYREVIINSEPLEKRVAVLSEGVMEKFELERVGDERLVGAIFKGRIRNLEPGLKAAFVDIGMPKNAFLHYWDILPQADSTVEMVRDTRTEAQREKKDKITVKDIPNLYPVGSEILVQITKSTIGSKGPRTTTNIALPGRFLVLMPFGGQCGVSRKIEDEKERKRLKDILKRLSIPEGMGVILRTAGEGKRWTYFVRDLSILLNQWREIQARLDEAKQPTCLYKEPDLIERTCRDFLTENVDRVLIDNKEDGERMLEIVGRVSKRSKGKIAIFQENIPIFERFNIERQIEQTFLRRVPLPSGGEIVIEETEALVAIDVNTGAHKQQKGDNTNFILQVNLEAAVEAARQIRLRNIGGLIILDFIDMKQRKERMAVYKKMKTEMEKDKAKSHVLQISTLGIMQMTRQRHKESVSSGLYNTCPYCNGRGTVKSPHTMSVEIQRRLISVIRRLQAQGMAHKDMWLRVHCHPHALERLRHEDEKILVEMEESYGVKLSFRADPAYHVENFKVFNAHTLQELR